MATLDLVPLIRQRLACDILPYEHDYWDVLNLVPSADEVREAEVIESNNRMKSVAAFQPFVEVYSVLAADIMSQVMYKNAFNVVDWDDSTDVQQFEQWHEAIVEKNRELVRSAVYPILAAMLEAGVITYGRPSGLVG